MANKKVGSRVKDADVEAANEIYKAGKSAAEMEIAKLREDLAAAREESETIGALKKINCDIAYNETLKYMILHRIKQNKDYKKGGLTWDDFCAAIGEPRRTTDQIIEEMRPVYEDFSAKLADLSGYGFNKIRHLGKALSANLAEIQGNEVVFGGETVPFSPEYKEEFQAFLDQIGDKVKEQENELKAQKKAFDKVQGETHKEMTKLQKQVDKLEGKAASKGFTAEEDAFLQDMDNKRTLLDGYLLQIDPERMEIDYDKTTPRMRAALITTLDYAKKQILKMHGYAVENYGDVEMMPEEGWQPE